MNDLLAHRAGGKDTVRTIGRKIRKTAFTMTVWDRWDGAGFPPPTLPPYPFRHSFEEQGQQMSSHRSHTEPIPVWYRPHTVPKITHFYFSALSNRNYFLFESELLLFLSHTVLTPVWYRSPTGLVPAEILCSRFDPPLPHVTSSCSSVSSPQRQNLFLH
jgi:hypothetical protein